MDWIGWVLLAAACIGLAAGVALVIRAWLTNPITLAAAAVFVFKQLVPRIVAYVMLRKSPEEEAKDRQKRRQGEELNRGKDH